MSTRSSALACGLARESFKGSNGSFQLQLLPLRMTEANLTIQASSPHLGFWRDLKAGTDIFEATRRPPNWDVCERRYVSNRSDPRMALLDPNGACPVANYSTMAAL